MRISKSIAAVLSGVALAAAAPALAEDPLPGMTPPKPDLTAGEGMGAFMKALLVGCLQSLEQQKPIAELDAGFRTDLVPATPQERGFQSGKDASVAVWSSKTLGSHLAVIETSAQRCDVRADQLPVERTFQSTIGALTHVMPDFQAVPQKPGYNPIVYQYEADRDGAHYVIHMEGAEPGGFGHASRFSLLSGWVTRK